MAKMVELERTLNNLRGLAARAKKGDGACRVGYSAPYAIFVHENLTAHHPIGQAKFLEQPARLLGDEISDVIIKSVMDGKLLKEAVKDGAVYLLKESQKLVPVQTGALRASGYVKEET